MRPLRLRNRAIAMIVFFAVGALLIVRELGASSSPAVGAPPKNSDVDDFRPVRIPNVRVGDSQEETDTPQPTLRPAQAPAIDADRDEKTEWKFKRRKSALQQAPPAQLRVGDKDSKQVQSDQDNVVDGPTDPAIHEPKNAGGRYPILKNGKFIASNRIFHFDLKGAAPRVPFYKELFAFLKSIGATGILIEWEDMFPYEGILADVRNGNAYSKDDIATILNWAVEADLDIIPLVQTFGHLEWILKLEKFAKYRQNERYPQVICLADDEAVNLVKTALDQVLAIHKAFPMPFFHIGADEAFQVGMCQKDIDLMRTKLEGSRERLMLRHISTIAQHVSNQVKTTKVLMWHDMLNNVDSGMLKQYKLGELVEPVVWNYAENLDDQLYPEMWERFGAVFPFIWGASAFKGADGPSRFYSNVPHYLANHKSWITQMTTAYKSFKQFRGLILTGWQRFDHFAVLCEILPVGLMSAAINFLTIKMGHYDRSILRDASTIMDCSNTIDIDAQGIAGYCTFPGSRVYQEVQQLKTAIEQTNDNVHKDYQVLGWLSPFNIKHNYSQAWYLDQVLDKINVHITDLESIAASLRRDMEPIFFPDTIDEFLFEYLEPALKQLKDLREGAIRLGATKHFPLRPIAVRSLLEQPKVEMPVAIDERKVARVDGHETKR